MLSAAIAYSLPMALGVALSPVPVAAVVTVLLSARPSNALNFLLGWVAGLVAIGALVFFIPGLESSGGEPTRLAGWIRLTVGVALLVMAAVKWQRRKTVDTAASPMLDKLDQLDPWGMTRLAFLLSGLNPKNLMFTFAGVSYIDASMAPPKQQALAFALYVAVASASIILPLVVHGLFSDRVGGALAAFKAWLVRNNAALMSATMLVLGAIVSMNGLFILQG